LYRIKIGEIGLVGFVTFCGAMRVVTCYGVNGRCTGFALVFWEETVSLLHEVKEGGCHEKRNVDMEKHPEPNSGCLMYVFNLLKNK
jgi:hypothetical protein